MICDAAGDYYLRSPIDLAVGLNPAVKVLRSQPTFPVSITTGTVRPLGAGVVAALRRRFRDRWLGRDCLLGLLVELPSVVIVRFNLWGAERSDSLRNLTSQVTFSNDFVDQRSAGQ